MFTCVSVRAECTDAAQSLLVLFSFFADGDSVVCHYVKAQHCAHPVHKG